MCIFFFFNDTATTEIYTLSLHDALPISPLAPRNPNISPLRTWKLMPSTAVKLPNRLVSCSVTMAWSRSEEHTSELQSRQYLVCRLLLEKKKKNKHNLRVSMKTL